MHHKNQAENNMVAKKVHLTYPQAAGLSEQDTFQFGVEYHVKSNQRNLSMPKSDFDNRDEIFCVPEKTNSMLAVWCTATIAPLLQVVRSYGQRCFIENF